GSGIETGAEEDEGAAAVSAAADVFDLNGAGPVAVRSDDHDVVVVAQILAAAVAGLGLGPLIIDQPGGHRGGAVGAPVLGDLGAMRVGGVVLGDVGPDVLGFQRDSQHQANQPGNGERSGQQIQAGAAAHGVHRLVV